MINTGGTRPTSLESFIFYVKCEEVRELRSESFVNIPNRCNKYSTIPVQEILNFTFHQCSIHAAKMLESFSFDCHNLFAANSFHLQ